MFINNFNKREKYLMAAAALICVIAVLYVFIIDPVAARWKNLNNQIRSKINMLEKDFKLAANQKTIESEYVKLSKRGSPARSKDQEVADTLAFIENVSKNDSCFIINIKPVDIIDSGSHKEILIDVTAEASVGQLSKFLYDIENPRENLINVKRFNVISKSGQTGVLRGTFLISKVLLD